MSIICGKFLVFASSILRAAKFYNRLPSLKAALLKRPKEGRKLKDQKT